MKNKDTLGLYLHVPFCASKCHYCDFYSFAGDSVQIDGYIAAMCREIASVCSLFSERPVDTVYFGGGTPSVLGGARLGTLLQAVRTHFQVMENAEITVECNPDSIDVSLLRALRQAGVNRLSVGVQSAHDGELRLLGRRHTFAQAKQAILLARQMGFDNISLDLMYGLPQQTEQDFMQSVQALLELEPAHLSCYGLKLEAGTRMAEQNPRLPDGDAQAELYLHLCDRLDKAGYQHYEISNWAKPNRESRHNSRYWKLSDYLGLGPGAHSCIAGKRFAYPDDLQAFCDAPKRIAEEPVAGFPPYAEYIMLCLRTQAGISVSEFEARFDRSFAPYAQRLQSLCKAGLTKQTEHGWQLTDSGFLVSNLIITEVLGTDDG